MTTSIRKRTARTAILLGVTLVASLQISLSATWGADCSKGANSKLAPCANATIKPGPGSSMQTIQQGGAEAQKKAAQATVETRTAATGIAGQGREKRTWVGQTALSCKKGTVTLHLAVGATQCPDGFHKS